MVAILVIIAFFVIISLKSSINKVNVRINKLEDELERFKGLAIPEVRKSNLDDNRVDKVEKNEEEVYVSKKTTSTASQTVSTQSSALKEPELSSAANKYIKKPKIVKDDKEKSQFWSNIEKLFAGNATGFIGVTAVIVGVIFLAIYAAISMGPFARFIVVCGFSVSFYAMYFVLSRYEFWKNIALWLKTASGVVFLVGCIGASQFPYMQWIYNDIQAWIFIVLGIFVNIAFGALSKKEMFATVHVVLSLFALLLVPFSYLSFIIAAIICFVGMIMTLVDRKWNIHIAVVNLSFLFLNIFWSMNYFSIWPSSSLPTITICLFVAVPCLMSHYRKIYQGWDNKALVSHLIIWVSLGLNLYIHARGTIWGTIGLGVGSFTTFVLSYYANKLKAEWLYICDRLVSLALGILTCTSLYKFDLEYYQMAFYASVFSVIFFKLNIHVKNKTVFNISNFVIILSYMIFLPMFFTKNIVDFEMFFYLLASFIVNAIIFPSVENYAKRESFGFSIDEKDKTKTTTLIPVFFAFHIIVAAYLATVVSVNNNIWFAVSCAMATYAIIFKNHYKNQLLDVVVNFVILVTSFYYMIIIYFKNYNLMLNLELSGIVLTLGILSIIFSWSEKLKLRSYRNGIIIIWSIIMLASYKFTIAYSTMLPGILWLLMFLVSSDLKEITWKEAKADEEKNNPKVLITRLAKFSFIAFVIRFCLVDLSNHTLLMDVVPARIGTEILSLIALIYWMISGTKINNVYIKKTINGLLEVFVVLSLFYIFAEVKVVEQGILIAGLALVSLFAGPKVGEYNRLALYSYLLFLIALFNVGFVSSTVATPSKALYDQVWFKSIITVVLTVIFTVCGSKKLSYIKSNQLIVPNKISSLMKSLIVKYDMKAIIYPLFLAVAFFLYRGFDKSILSVLWMMECFILFIISIILKKSEFRVVSMFAVALIFVRIMFFDLRGQDFLVKAIVFIIIGSILIIMNAIYNKYKYRYEK